MKKRVKRILSLCLAAVIVATSAGYGPPVIGAVTATPSTATKTTEYMATPSEAIPLEEKSTPSEATPSEAERKFVRVDPEEIPEYYSRESRSGKKFWKFEDRYGNMHYRDYGFVQGEAEFPLWYETDEKGAVETTASIQLDDEYFNLAPYIYKSVIPGEVEWDDLYKKEGILEYEKEINSFKNWDLSSYDIWSLSKSEEDTNTKESKFYFFGSIKNKGREEGSAEWYRADKDGNILGTLKLKMSLMAAPVNKFGIVQYYQWPTVNQSTNNLVQYKSVRVGDYSKPYLGQDDNFNPIKWDYPANLETFTLDTPSYPGYKFLGWTAYSCTNMSSWSGPQKKEEAWANPENYPFVYGYQPDYNNKVTIPKPEWTGHNIATTGYALLPGGLTSQIRGFMGLSGHDANFWGVWVPEDKPYLILIDDIADYKNYWIKRDSSGKLNFSDEYSTHLVDDAIIFRSISVKPYGTEIDTGYLTKSDPMKAGYIFGGYFSGLAGTGEKLGNTYTYNKPDDRYYAYWIPEDTQFTVTYKDWDGSILHTEVVKPGEDCSQVPMPNRPGYEFTGWDYPTTNIIRDLTLTAQYASNGHTLTLDGNGGKVNDSDTKLYELEKDVSIDQILSDAISDCFRTYYTFEGWYTQPTGGTKYGLTGNTMPDYDLTLYAHWIRSSSLVTFYDWEGNVIGTQIVEMGESATLPTPPVRHGYTFIGWDTDTSAVEDHTNVKPLYKVNSYELKLNANGGMIDGDNEKVEPVAYGTSFDQILKDGRDHVNYEYYTFAGWYTSPTGGSKYDYTGNLMPASNITIYAHWTRISSLVTFYDWEGNVIGTQIVEIGGSATLPTSPIRPGYTFIGWDTDVSAVGDHTNVRPLYKVNSYELTLDANGGALYGNSEKTESIVYGASYDTILRDGRDNANRKYYTFDGWYSAPSGGNRYPESENRMPDADVTVYAHWIRSSSLVTYKDWTGATIDTQEVAIGADATPPAAPERPGYTFSGWDKPSTSIQDHTIITAQYTINGYLLTLDGNGGSIDGAATKEQVLSYDDFFDQILTEGRDQISRPGYTFEGWYTEPEGGSNYSYSGNQMPAENVTVYAHWTVNNYEVTFDPDHVRWSGGVTQRDYSFNTKLGALPAPEIYGWEFTGWWTGKNGTGTKITDETMVEPRDATYYGSWEPVTYQIKYISRAEQPGGESVQTFARSQKYDQPLGTLPEPEEKGYTFTGWYDEENEKVSSQTIFSPDPGTEGYTYYAGWTANTYKIRFAYNDSNGIPVITEIDGTYHTKIGELPVPEKPGYIFIGWYKDNGEKITSGSWVEAGDTEYKARWKADQYTISFKRNLSGSLEEDPEDKTVTYGIPIGELPILHEKGYVFLGWYTEAVNGSRIKETTLAALGDQTYYAHWTTGWIDNGNGTYSRPGADGTWNTEDDEIWWIGPDGISGTDDDKIILIGGPGSDGKPIYYVDNGDGTHTRPGTGGNWNIGDTEHWWNGSDGQPGTEDDKEIFIGGPGQDGKTIYYIDNGDGTHIRPGTGGDWNIGDTEHWWNGSDGQPGTEDDKEIHIGGPDPDGEPIHYIDNGDGTHTRPGPDETWGTDDDEIWRNGPDDLPGTGDDYKKNPTPGPTDPEPTEPTEPKPTEPGPSNPAPTKESEEGGEESTEVITPVIPVIDSKAKPTVPDTGGTFTVNPDNPYEVTYTKPDGTLASDEWVGDGEDWYHVDADGTLNYDWYLEGQKTWYKLNKELGDKFGAALIGWNYETMDDKRYFFDPGTGTMLTGWQLIDNEWYYFTKQNEAQTYFGDNRKGWLYDPTKPGKPYGSMYRNESMPDGYRVDEKGAWIN